MPGTYDEQLDQKLKRRRQRAAQKKAQREAQRRKNIIIFVAVVVLVIVAVFAIRAIAGNFSSGLKKEAVTTEKATEAATTQETTTSPETTEEQTTNIVGKTMYTTDVLNLRQKASTNSKVVTAIVKGKAVKIISVDNLWCKISYEGSEGYVQLKYLTEKQPKDE